MPPLPAPRKPLPHGPRIPVLRWWRKFVGGGKLLGVWDAVRTRDVAPVLTAVSSACLAMSCCSRRPCSWMPRPPIQRGPRAQHDEDEECGLVGYPMQDLVELECKFCAKKDKNVKYEVRNNRKGYKAGALKEGMLHAYAQQCDFLAVFHVDFQLEPEFLMRTIPYLARNPKIALVQARWEFVSNMAPILPIYHSRTDLRPHPSAPSSQLVLRSSLATSPTAVAAAAVIRHPNTPPPFYRAPANHQIAGKEVI